MIPDSAPSMPKLTNSQRTELKNLLGSAIDFSASTLLQYATDASVYRQVPLGVFAPTDIKTLMTFVQWLKSSKIQIIPRAAGTSLAGQCVGEAIIVDFGHLPKVLDFHTDNDRVTVSPSWVRDDLNRRLRSKGLHFGPNTSTANRCQIGGMIGNNSSGSSSIRYGTTRDKLSALRVLLTDGTQMICSKLTKDQVLQKSKLSSREGDIYRTIIALLEDADLRKAIREQYPKPSIHRRNSGYAMDILLSQWTDSEEPHLNLSSLLAGSEGTLAITLDATLSLDPLPESHRAIIAFHFESVESSLKFTHKIIQTNPDLCELMDRTILDCTRSHPSFQETRSHLIGDPEAILLVRYRHQTQEGLISRIHEVTKQTQKWHLHYGHKVLPQPLDQEFVYMRKAGLGLLANLPGDAKAVACIEDTAVDLQDLAAYIGEFTEMMESFGQKAVYYAHAGAGELHLRPVLNLKKSDDIAAFVEISRQSAELVKKYQGALSGEHGDGIVRSYFLPIIFDPQIMDAFRKIKESWDPDYILNPGKIVNPSPIDRHLRYEADRKEPKIESFYSFQEEGGILRMAEKCNGSGDCRKSAEAGGTMCPSYHATGKESETTRARANILREILTNNTEKPFESPELDEVMDLCLSCKGCTSECPSQVNMTLLKSEWLYQKYHSVGFPLRSRFFARSGSAFRQMGVLRGILGHIIQWPGLQALIKKSMGIHAQRSLPSPKFTSLRRWYAKSYVQEPKNSKEVYLFVDAFTEFLDVEIGKQAVQVLSKCGYNVQMIDHPESGRAAMSKGLLEYARECADVNVRSWKSKVSDSRPLVGIEPSAILSFRDEYPRLVSAPLREAARALSRHCFTIEEFLFNELKEGKISLQDLEVEETHVLIHGHCHQKALSDIRKTAILLESIKGYNVLLMDTGCCGMAGSFGFEQEHYDLSMRIAETRLFPQLREYEYSILCAPGTSCRHQVKDGLSRRAYHPVELIYKAMNI